MSFSKHIKELNRKVIHNTPEFLGQSSQYRLDKTIHNYSTDLVQAYTLIQTNASHNNQECFSLVSKLPQVVDYSRLISFYNLGKVSNMLNIVGYGVTRLDGKEVFGLVLPYIPPERLVSNNISLLIDKPDIVLQYVILPILETLVQLHSSDLTHGCINQDNVWLNFDASNGICGATISNTLLELPGYSQNPIYEPLNRMLVHRSGKTSSKEADCYAVGILLASLLSGKTITKKGYEAIVKARAKNGSYETVINMYFNGNDSLLDKSQQVALYWLLHDDESKRWSGYEAIRFIRRRHRKVTLDNGFRGMKVDIENQLKLIKPLTFSNEECYSMTEAAISSIRHYDEIKIKVKNGKLVKELLSNDSIKGDFISKISKLRSLDGFEGSGLISKEDMFLTTFIILLNKSMPIKLKDITVEPNAVWQMSKYVSNQPLSSGANILHKAIHSNVISKVNKLISTICGVKIHSINLPNLEVLQYLSEEGIRNCLYSYTEPNSIYLLDERICFSIGDVMEVLNSFNEEYLLETIDNEDLLGYLLGKLGGKLQLKVERNSVLDPTTDKFAMFFMIISHAYNFGERKALKNLSDNLYRKLSRDYLGKIKYLKLRKRVDEKLKIASEAGDIGQMYKILQWKEIDRKNAKYIKVVEKVDRLNDKLNQPNDAELIKIKSRQRTIRLAGAFFIGVLLFILYHIS